MHELRRVYGCLPGGGVLQLRSPSDRQYRADAGRRCDRGAHAQRCDLVLRRVYVVPAPLSPRQYSRLCHPGAADAFPKARFLRREREGAAATGPQAHDRGEYPPYGLLCDPETGEAELHPEQGTVWEWIYENDEEIYGQFSAAYNRPGAGALRKLDDRSMEELHRIFDVTGGKEFFDTIEKHSDRKAREMGYDGADDEYMMDTYTKNSNEHY